MQENIDNISKIPVTSMPNTEPAPTQKEETVWELVRFALIVLVIAIGLRFFVAQPFVVSGSSMVPTFTDKDYLIIDELTYDFKSPMRGDVVVFHPPNQPRGIYYIKRIIGLPGETITISGGTVKITNTEHPDGYVLSEPYISAQTNNNLVRKIGADEYFVMGDNRPFSSDSRSWGVLPRKNIVGRTFLRLLPITQVGVLPGDYTTYFAK